MANRTQLQTALQKPYDRILFAKEVLSPVFGAGFSLSSGLVLASIQPTKTEQLVIDTVSIYGNITLEDSTEITCYQIVLQPTVRIEQNKVAIQRYVRKLLIAGQAALVNFIAPQNKKVWRLTLVAKDSEVTTEGIKEKITHAKRYTYLLGPTETCKTAAERFETLSTESLINFDALVNAFSVEKLSIAFFNEYTLHYENFIHHLNSSAYKRTVFKGDEKAIRDFTKKLLGRIVFLYFVQKKGWLGATDTSYKDGMTDFMKSFFKSSGGDENFYSNWLTGLFFETLNKERANDDFKMPDGKKLKVPFLNGGLFDKEEYDKNVLTFKPKLFHNPDNEDVILTEKNKSNSRGFLDFLNAFNFTVHEDSPDDHTVAVDPEMLSHIFENLLEDNKDKGAFYTPKAIVHYMCQESLIEYLTTHLSKEYTVYRQIGKEQIEIFGNETRQGQLKIMEQLGDKALNRDDVAYIVKRKDISKLTKSQLKRIDSLLDRLKSCDPAIGSGAFPMGLLLEIFAIKEVIAYELGNPWKPAEVKEKIIQNSIYGVDIEKGAVDIARLRFWLSLVVDEDKPKALPNLDYKIVVGNSLLSKFEDEVIDIDWTLNTSKSTEATKTIVVQQAAKLNTLQSWQREYFHQKGDKQKQQLEIRNIKIDILSNQLTLSKISFQHNNPKLGGFAATPKEIQKNLENEIKVARFDKTIQKLQAIKKDKNAVLHFFDWKLDFPEVMNEKVAKDKDNIGFDIVIANPPYVSIEGIPWDDRRHYETIYKTATGRFDLYSLFIEKAMELKVKNGVFIYIIPGKFLNNKQFITARKMVCENHGVTVVKIDEKVFEEAQVDSVIVENYSTSSGKYRAYKFSKNDFSLVSETDVASILQDKEVIFKIEINSEFENLIAKIESNTVRVKQIGDVKDGIVAGTIKDLLFIDKKKDKDSHKLYFGKHLTRYRLIDTDVWVSYKPDEMMKAEIKRKGDKRPGLWMRDEKIFKREKILSRFVAKEIIATYDNEGRYYEHTLHSTHIEDKRFKVKFVLALFNSNLLKFYYHKTNSQGGDIFPQVRIASVEKLPIKIAIISIQAIFEKLVDYILFLKTQNLSNTTDQLMPTYFERLIDAMVYELYFPELLKKQNCEIIKHLGELPEFADKMSDDKKMSIVKTVFNRLHDKTNMVKINLEKMKEIEEIKIIEGNNENSRYGIHK